MLPPMQMETIKKREAGERTGAAPRSALLRSSGATSTEIRRPKSEGRKKAEIRNSKSPWVYGCWTRLAAIRATSPVLPSFGVRPSDFGLLSDFGLRISELSPLRTTFTRHWERPHSGCISFLLIAFLALLAGCTPPGPRALLQGKKLIEQGKYPAAVTKLEAATSILGTNAQAWNYLGLA